MSFREFIKEAAEQQSMLKKISQALTTAKIYHKSVYGKLVGTGWSIYPDKYSKKPNAFTFSITDPDMKLKDQSKIQTALNQGNYQAVVNGIKAHFWGNVASSKKADKGDKKGREKRAADAINREMSAYARANRL